MSENIHKVPTSTIEDTIEKPTSKLFSDVRDYHYHMAIQMLKAFRASNPGYYDHEYLVVIICNLLRKERP